LRGRARRWCWPTGPAWPGRSVFFFLLSFFSGIF
jgi:hypothetical protein